MRINYINKTIEMTNPEAKRAAIIGSKEYDKLVSTMKDFPTFKIAIIAPERKKKTESYKGLDYDFIERFISLNGTPEQLTEFNKMRYGVTTDHIMREPYAKVKKWFLAQFKGVGEYATENGGEKI